MCIVCVRAHRCDREDRHRGLCNHRATIAGPTAIPTTGSASSELEEDSEDEEQEGQGTSQMDAGAQRFLCVVALVGGAPALRVRCAQGLGGWCTCSQARLADKGALNHFIWRFHDWALGPSQGGGDGARGGGWISRSFSGLAKHTVSPKSQPTASLRSPS